MDKTAYLRSTVPAYEAHDKGRKALAEDKTKEARSLVSTAIRLEPKEAMFHALSGDIYAADDKLRQAELAYNDALRRDDSFFYHYLRRGQVRYERKHFSAARTDLEHSLELLPTAQANFLLGNMDKRAGNLDSAIKYYQAASQSNSPAGKEAQKELVYLDLPKNPGKYIQTKAYLEQNGTLSAAVRNNSPVVVSRISLKVEYIDDNNQVREFSKSIRKTLQPGEQTAVTTKIRSITDANELSKRVRLTVVGAKIVEQ